MEGQVFGRRAFLCAWQVADLQDGDLHEPDMVVRQQLHFDVGRADKGQGYGPDVGGHWCQSQLDPQLALQVKVAHQDR